MWVWNRCSVCVRDSLGMRLGVGLVVERMQCVCVCDV